MKRLKSIRRIALLALLGSVPACTLIPKAEPIRVFLLPGAQVPAPGATQAFDQALRIHTPQASRILAGPRIAVVPQGNQISSYQGARWSDTAPTLLRDRLIEAFQQAGPMTAVSSENDNLHADLELLSDLRAFQSEYIDGAPQVHIRLDASLVQGTSRKVLASRRFDIRQRSTDERVESIVTAFGQASDELSRQLIEWTLAQPASLSPY